MDVLENIKKVIQDLILPELEIIKAENNEIKTILEFTNKRIDDVNKRIDDVNKRIDDINTHLVDQSRRIDEINNRIDELRVELKDEIDNKISDTNRRIDDLRIELRDGIANTNKRIDRLYEVIVRRDEYDKLEIKIMMIENEVSGLKMKIAA